MVGLELRMFRFLSDMSLSETVYSSLLCYSSTLCEACEVSAVGWFYVVLERKLICKSLILATYFNSVLVFVC